MEAAGYTASMSLKDIQHDIEATEQTLLAIASKDPDRKNSKQAAATSLLALLRLKAQVRNTSSENYHEVVRDSCTSLITPQPGSRHSSHPSSMAQSALLDTKLQECCSVLEPVIDKGTASEIVAVLDSLYGKQLQLLSDRCQAQMPKSPGLAKQPATAAPAHLDATHQLKKRDNLPPGSAHASSEQSPLSHRPVAVSVTWQERSSVNKGGADAGVPHGAPDLALPEDAPNLASPAPGAFAPPAGRGTPRWAPRETPPTTSDHGWSSELPPEELRERGGPFQVTRSEGRSAAVEVDRHGRVVASASGQHAAAAAPGLPAARAKVLSAAEREALLTSQLEQVRWLPCNHALRQIGCKDSDISMFRET